MTTIYKGKYPKRINSIYFLKAGGYGATLNDGTLIKFTQEAIKAASLKWSTGYEPKATDYEVIGQSKLRTTPEKQRIEALHEANDF